jgi:hypothetical protein
MAPNAARADPHRSRERERLLSRAIIDWDTGCWNWSGSLRKGYGRIRIGDRRPPSHIAVYELLVGPIPEGLQIDHLCRNRACCNPAHLEPVTQRTNVLRGEAPTAVNAHKTHCVNGHEYDLINTYFRPSGGRDCRACQRHAQRAYQDRKKAAA